MPKQDPITLEEMEEKRQEKKKQRKAWLVLICNLLEFLESLLEFLSNFIKPK